MILPDSTPDEAEDDLRGAMTRTDQQFVPSPVPLPAILHRGRQRRVRQRAALAAACAVVVVAAAVPIANSVSRTATQPPTSSSPSPTLPAAALPTSVVAGSGTLDGKPWSVTLEYHAKLPSDFEPGDKMGTSAPGTGLLCTRVTIGGVRVDHQGGAWADCSLTSRSGGSEGGAGFFGLTGKGLTGSRVLVGTPGRNVTRAVVTFTDGEQLQAAVKPLAGTQYRAYAVPVASGRTISTVDEYNAANQRVGHETDLH
ncbi:hypothetical protein AB0L70_02150 [Kribbella sp. NPDC051952]|uniref:hypothetical protein n=1 Tax=Kribbella sp. NPDC051952 TaxID=3154851 RepID=UPI00342101E1